jgi:ABC-type lipoprotein export system ATPase subunit
MFQRLNAEQNITIVLVTHDNGVAQFAKRVIRMRDGQIEAGLFIDQGQESHERSSKLFPSPAGHSANGVSAAKEASKT